MTHEKLGTASPHENLQLDDASILQRRSLAVIARQFGSAILTGTTHSHPVVREKYRRMYERIKNPVVGDFVFETTTLLRRDQDMRQIALGIGILIEDTVEPSFSDEVWAEEKAYAEGAITDSDRPTERVYYVQYGPQPEDVARWTDANFQVIPTDPDFGRES
ncbi:MAG: hypothetical protein JWM81_1062 [Candidatus Saccharibacteria bacterium]|nr:hypothetical protein [Candidatus Saccharibacteria bacterium]